MVSRPSATSPWLLGLLAVAMSVGCRSRKSRDEAPGDRAPTTDERRSLSLKPITVTRQKKTYEKPPELPRLHPVELLSAGTKPHKTIRYRLDETEREFTITANLETREYIGGAWSERKALPEVTIGLGLRRTGADNELWVVDIRGLLASTGAERTGERAGEAGGTADTRQALDAFLTRYRAYLERRRAQLSLTDRGRPGKPILTPDARMSDDRAHIANEMSQLLLESIVPLPEEPIGKGARWRAVSLLYRGPSVVKQTAEYDLLTAAKGKMRLGVRITQIGEHQIIDAPELKHGQRAELIALFWQVTGELELDPGVPTPVAGTLTSELRVHGRIVGARGNQDYSLETTGPVKLRTSAAR